MRSAEISASSVGCSAVILSLLLGGCGDEPKTPLRDLLDSYTSASAQEIKERLDRLSLQDHYIMEYGGQLGPAFRNIGAFLRACEVDPSIHWTSLRSLQPMTCGLAQTSYDQINTIGVGSAAANVESGRNQILIYLKCQSGEIDQGSCSMYYGVQAAIDQAYNQTSQVILDNIAGKCEVGTAGCYP